MKPQQPRNPNRIIAILSDRIKALELDNAFLLDEIFELKDKLKEVEQNGDSTD